jgi:hypothetical protein
MTYNAHSFTRFNSMNILEMVFLYTIEGANGFYMSGNIYSSLSYTLGLKSLRLIQTMQIEAMGASKHIAFRGPTFCKNHVEF